MCSASEAPSLPGSGNTMRPWTMRPPQDQIQALAQPRQRRAKHLLSRASRVLSPKKGSVQCFFISHKGITGAKKLPMVRIPSEPRGSLAGK